MDYHKQKIIWAKRREQIRKMRLEGLSVIAIALKLGITRQRVYQMLK